MKKSLVVCTLLLLCFVSKAQSIDKDSVTRSYYAMLNDIDAYGIGNEKIVRNIKSMYAFFCGKHDVNSFLNSLARWGRLAGTESVGFDWNEKTQEHDIPVFDMVYTNSRLQDDEAEYRIEFGADKIVKSVEFKVFEFELEDHIIPQLKALGFVKDKNRTRFSNELERGLTQQPERKDRNAYYTNSAKKLSVHIAYVGGKYYQVAMLTINPETKQKSVANK